MTLVDNETGESIINPYITISPFGDLSRWVAINASTFGEDGQGALITFDSQARRREDMDRVLTANFNESRVEKERRDKYFQVTAVVAKLNSMTPTVRTEGIGQSISVVTLGYLPEDFVREHFKNSYNFFSARTS